MSKQVRRLITLVALTGFLTSWIGFAAAQSPVTTATQTINDQDGDYRLETGPGEAYIVRTELAAAISGREHRRTQRITFAQLTDMQIVDEESPLRVEFLDTVHPMFRHAYRPHEGLSPILFSAMISQLRTLASPVTDHSLELAMTTGDNTDGNQRNETRWMIDILDGGQINPNSGVPGSCGTLNDGHLYDGIRGDGVYYDPNGLADGAGYAADAAINQQAIGRPNSVRDIPGLFEAMNRPFQSPGIGVPWYAVFGNHDTLVQGNVPHHSLFETLATGCTKITAMPGTVISKVQELTTGELSTSEFGTLLLLVDDTINAIIQTPQQSMGLYKTVPRDPQRVPLRKSAYIYEHFTTSGTPVGHGFSQGNVASAQGNYAFTPKPGLRFIVLDTVSENGFSRGNIDDTQFRWLHAELARAESNRDVVIVFGHHSLRTMNQSPITPFSLGQQDGEDSLWVHYGLGSDDTTASCTLISAWMPPTPFESLRCLFLRHPSVIGYVAGHEHGNHITPFERRSNANVVTGGFWELTTASHVDWPQQSRLIDLVDNEDGSFSIFGTMVNHSGPVAPGGPPSLEAPLSAEAVSWMASVGRELSYNDPQASNGRDGTVDDSGTVWDRNVELVINNPYQ